MGVRLRELRGVVAEFRDERVDIGAERAGDLDAFEPGIESERETHDSPAITVAGDDGGEVADGASFVAATDVPVLRVCSGLFRGAVLDGAERGIDEVRGGAEVDAVSCQGGMIGVMLSKPRHLDPSLAPLWDEFAPQVHSRIGTAGLEALLTCVLRLRRSRARINLDGEVVASEVGRPIPHPALNAERSASAEIRAWMIKFGA